MNTFLSVRQRCSCGRDGGLIKCRAEIMRYRCGKARVKVENAALLFVQLEITKSPATKMQMVLRRPSRMETQR